MYIMRRMITGLSIQGCRIYFCWGSAPNPVKGLSPLKPAIFFYKFPFSTRCHGPQKTQWGLISISLIPYPPAARSRAKHVLTAQAV